MVDTSSVEIPDSFDWVGAQEGRDYSFGRKDADGPAALDATLVSSAPLTLNASVSSYTAPLHIVACSQLARSQPPACMLKLPKALSFLLTKGIDTGIPASTIISWF